MPNKFGEGNIYRPTPEEARERGRKGGIASGVARQKKKAMKETLETILSLKTENGKAVDLETVKSLASLQGKNLTVQEAILLRQVQKSMKGDTKAAEYVRDTSGNKPTTETKTNVAFDDGFLEAISGTAETDWSEDSVPLD